MYTENTVHTREPPHFIGGECPLSEVSGNNSILIQIVHNHLVENSDICALESLPYLKATKFRVFKILCFLMLRNSPYKQLTHFNFYSCFLIGLRIQSERCAYQW